MRRVPITARKASTSACFPLLCYRYQPASHCGCAQLSPTLPQFVPEGDSMRHLLTAALLLAGTAANAQTIPVDTMKEVTKEISSDAYEGRAPATPAEEKTLNYIIERFQKAGLKPGNKGSWLQDVPLVQITPGEVPA